MHLQDEVTDNTYNAIAFARELAKNSSHAEFTPLHLAVCLLSDHKGIFRESVSNAADDEHVVNAAETLFNEALQLNELAAAPSNLPDEILPSESMLKVLDSAHDARRESGDTFLALHQLVLGLLKDSQTSSLLKEAGIDQEMVRKDFEQLQGEAKKVETDSKHSDASEGNGDDSEDSDDHSNKSDDHSSNNSDDSCDLSYVNKYGRDLVAQAGNLGPVIGREEEIKNVITILSRRTKNSAILIGNAGVGKTAVVEGLAQRMAKGEVPQNLVKKRLIALNIGTLSTQRINSVLEDVERAKGKVILFLDELHTLLQDEEAANLFKPMFGRGQLRCIGATTFHEYRKHVEKDVALERRFQKVHVQEPTIDETVTILRGLKKKHEEHHRVRIQDSAIVEAARLSSRYITGRSLPDKAIDLVDEACANLRVELNSQPKDLEDLERRMKCLEVELEALEAEDDEISKARFAEVRKELANLKEKLQLLIMKHRKEKERISKIGRLKKERENVLLKLQKLQKKYDSAKVAVERVEADIKKLEKGKGADDEQLAKTVRIEHIAMVVSRHTGIPVTRLEQNEKERLLGLAERLHQRVVGQDQAVDSVADAILRSRVGLKRHQQPIGSFLFSGPTGVGKTELAKALAEQLFDNENHLIRFDMSEYTKSHSVARLFGAPPGYVGYEEGGQLTEAVKQRPYSVVLFDEVEKADVTVFDSLLQVLDDGRLTDGQGHTVDFKNTVIIMTSNIGSKHLLSGLAGKMKMQDARDKVMEEMMHHFRPEFLSRLDERVVFDPLSQEQLRKVSRSQMADVTSRLAEKGITFHVTEAAIDYVLTKSYDPLYGARPVRRWLERNVVTELSRMLVREEIQERCTVCLDAVPSEDRLTYQVEQKTLAENEAISCKDGE